MKEPSGFVTTVTDGAPGMDTVTVSPPAKPVPSTVTDSPGRTDDGSTVIAVSYARISMIVVAGSSDAAPSAVTVTSPSA